MNDASKQFNAEQRKKAASKGQAQKDGSFPIQNAQDLKNAISAYGRSKNKAATKAHIIRRAKALGLTKLLPSGWGSKDKAMRDDAYIDHLLEAARQAAGNADLAGSGYQTTQVTCFAPECGRTFFGMDRLQDHAEAVHTFEDIRRILAEYIREEFGRTGDYKATPPVPGIWTWIDDLAADWVAFVVEEGNDSKLLKASYTIVDGNVTLGEPTEVRRRTVYEPVNTKDPES